MTDYNTLMLVSAALAAALMLATWALSLALRDASIVDVAWGAGLVLVAWTAFAIADGAEPRKLLVATLTTVWGVRLSGYLWWRRRGAGEDFRYRELRARHGARFGLVSLGSVFAFQGLGLWAVSLPVLAAQVPATPDGLTALDLAGAALWAVGMAFEVGGDAQLARFRADPANRGRVLDRGLWRYSRHPNYFGELCVWWGVYLIALATSEAWWSIAGPLTMTLILLRLSGVREMDDHLRRTKPGYDDYVRRTSALLPRPPRRAAVSGGTRVEKPDA